MTGMVPMADVNALAALSPMERLVLERTAQGLSTKQIAAERGVSVKTIEAQRQRAAQKVRARGVADLTRFAIRVGLVAA